MNPGEQAGKKQNTFSAEQEILELVKLKLYQKSHGLAPILGALELRVEAGEREKEAGGNTENSGSEDGKPEGVFRTDGRCFYLDAKRLRADFLGPGRRETGLGSDMFPSGSDWLCLELLHMLCHCLLGHPFQARRQEQRTGQGSADRDRASQGSVDRDLAWDLEAWKLAEELWGEPLPFVREAEELLAEVGELDTELSDKQPVGRKVCALLYVDDHSGWLRVDERRAAWWQGQGEKLLRNGRPKGRRKAGTVRRSREQRLVPAAGERGDYRAILRGFSTWREDARVSPEEFQYSWYSYGLQLYGNLPLIEPLEYSEERKIADLVIVIDTSGSCEKELVRVFLEETRGILEQERLFFRRFCLHIIQCDNQIQRDDCIHSREEFETYLETLTIRGGGGTDFRPAFERIQELQREGELASLRGILYFTDGCGRYPAREPDYQVWFVMLKNHFDAIDMPGWVHRLILEEKK